MSSRLPDTDADTPVIRTTKAKFLIVSVALDRIHCMRQNTSLNAKIVVWKHLFPSYLWRLSKYAPTVIDVLFEKKVESQLSVTTFKSLYKSVTRENRYLPSQFITRLLSHVLRLSTWRYLRLLLGAGACSRYRPTAGMQRPRRTQQPTSCTPPLLSIDGTDGRTDGHPAVEHRLRFA